MTDPIQELEHVHHHLTKLALGIGEELRDENAEPRPMTSERRREVLALLETLRDELLQHFADEEEALFPFVRRAVPDKAAAVAKLESSHDAICGAVVRLARLAGHDEGPQLVILYERFEHAYVQHSRDESALLEDVGRRLGAAQRAELVSLLRDISRH